MNAWQYTAIRKMPSIPKTLAALDRLGAKGWELVTISGSIYWLKRPGPVEELVPIHEAIANVVDDFMKLSAEQRTREAEHAMDTIALLLTSD